MKYFVEDGKLKYTKTGRTTVLGPAGATIYADAREQDVQAFKKAGCLIAMLPWGDFVFVTPTGKVCALEMKRPSDLVGSYFKRRLQRQLRREKLSADIPALGLRETGGRAFMALYEDMPDDLRVDLAKWQVLGGLVIPLPEDAASIVRTITDLRAVLQPGDHLYTIVAGTDEERRKPKVQMDNTAKALYAMSICGPKTAIQVSAYFKGSLVKALSATDAEWKAAGANKTSVTKLRVIIPERGK